MFVRRCGVLLVTAAGLLTACAAPQLVQRLPTVTPPPRIIPTATGTMIVTATPPASALVALPTAQAAASAILTPPPSVPRQVPKPATPPPLPTNPPLNKEAAWGTQYTVHKVPIKMGDDHVIIPITVTPDGRYLVGSKTPRRLFSEPAVFGMLDVESLQFTPIHAVATNETQVVGADADDAWIVWSEAARQPDLADWVLYAYNRQTQEVQQIAQAATGPDGEVVSGTFLLPKVDHGIVVWDEVVVTPDGAYNIVVKHAELPTGKVELLADPARAPAISWPYIAWLARLNEPSTQLEDTAKSVITVLNVETGEKHTLTHPDTPRYFALHGTSLVWITAPGSQAILTDLDETFHQVIAHADGDDYLEFPTIGDRIVAWTSTSQGIAWDRTQQRLIELSPEGVINFTNGTAYVWETPLSVEQYTADKRAGVVSNTETLYVIDTTTLPTTPPN